MKQRTKANLKGNKAITLIALVVTIIILIILAGATLNLVLSKDGLIARAKEAVEKYKEAQEKEEEDIKELDGELADRFGNTDRYGRIKVNPPELKDGMIPIKYDQEKNKWVITNKEDEEWYDYSEGKMLWANVMLSDGKYKTSEKEDNSKDGHYSDDGTTEVEDNELGSMFVWIPRYAYSFNEYHTQKDGGEGTTQKITNVVFLNGTSNEDYENNMYPTTYNPIDVEEGKPTPMIVHPGFTFDNKKLTGIWVGKFEASMSGKNENTEKTNDINTNNTLLDAQSVKVLPNKDTWRYISLGNIFINCLNMNGENNIYGIKKSQVDTHLMKNIEWGVTSYLAASQYGNVPTLNNSGSQESNISHQYSGGENYAKNTSQSTTNNITGIYDMNGGNMEYVAAYYDNSDNGLIEFAEDIFQETEKGIVLKAEYSKYLDKYEVSEEERKVTKRDNKWRNWELWDARLEDGIDDKVKKMTKERCDLMSKKIGDGTYETIKGFNYFWGYKNGNSGGWIESNKDTYYNGDRTSIGVIDKSTMRRGGSWSNSSENKTTGIFSIQDSGGRGVLNTGFRPVLSV